MSAQLHHLRHNDLDWLITHSLTHSFTHPQHRQFSHEPVLKFGCMLSTVLEPLPSLSQVASKLWLCSITWPSAYLASSHNTPQSLCQTSHKISYSHRRWPVRHHRNRPPSRILRHDLFASTTLLPLQCPTAFDIEQISVGGSFLAVKTAGKGRSVLSQIVSHTAFQ